MPSVRYLARPGRIRIVRVDDRRRRPAAAGYGRAFCFDWDFYRRLISTASATLASLPSLVTSDHADPHGTQSVGFRT